MFFNCIAAGSISSIAASFWEGGSSTIANADGTFTTIAHKGIGAYVGMNNGFGTIAFGTVMGGAGSRLGGGNFWQGAVTGLIVSMMNHAMHQIDPPGVKKGRKSPTLDEANEHYRNAKGKPMTVDASTVDLNFLDTSNWEIEKTYFVQTLTTSKDGRVYGGITVKYLGNNKVSILPDTYNFEQHGSFFSSTFRNIGNLIGSFYAGNGMPFRINFIGINTINYSAPPVLTYSQTAHAFRM